MTQMSDYPDVLDVSLVGTYPALAKAGSDYFCAFGSHTGAGKSTSTLRVGTGSPMKTAALVTSVILNLGLTFTLFFSAN